MLSTQPYTASFSPLLFESLSPSAGDGHGRGGEQQELRGRRKKERRGGRGATRSYQDAEPRAVSRTRQRGGCNG
eukprot:647824-Hanusia_phi.AAC.1